MANLASEYLNPDALVSAQWLADNLATPGLRVFDCTVYLRADSIDSMYRVVSGRADYNIGHIPGAAFIDLQEDISDNSVDLRFTVPALDALAQQFAQQGIGNDSRVVLYSRSSMQWATRVWWMLRAVGFDNAAILDGGWERWERDGRPVATEPTTYPPAQLSPKPRPDLFVGSQAVQDAGADSSQVVINALSAELHAGHSPRYGRPGRIPGSVNVPANAMRDGRELTVLPASQTRASFEAVGVDSDKRTIVYCGGGIAATLDAFVLHQLGHQNVAVYDNSLNEWAKDDTLPMESDPV